MAEVNALSFINMVEGGKTPLLSANKLQEIGYSMVGYTASTGFTTVKALMGTAEHLMKNDTTKDIQHKMISFDEFLKSSVQMTSVIYKKLSRAYLVVPANEFNLLKY